MLYELQIAIAVGLPGTEHVCYVFLKLCQLLTALLVLYAAREESVIVRSSVYLYVPHSPDLHANLGQGAEAWAGYKQAVKACQDSLFLNIDLAATAFLAAKDLPSLVADMVRASGPSDLKQGLRPRDLSTVKKALFNVAVSTLMEHQAVNPCSLYGHVAAVGM